MIAFIALIIAIVGALGYAFSANPKAAELFKITFFCGFFVFVSVLGARTVRLF